MDGVVRVLIVDDSAYVRKVVKQMLSRSPFIEVVGAARDGEEALELVRELSPDVVTLDLVMPRMDGVAFLREQMSRRPLPVLVLSIASETSEMMLRALEAGAVDLVQKPTALATERIFEISDELVEKVKAVARARPRAAAASIPLRPSTPRRKGRGTAVDVVVLGISTGGPQALKYLIPQFAADFPVPVAIVLHMPVGYTELYARSLAELTSLAVAEASENDVLLPGAILLAPGGRHMTLVRRSDGTVAVHLDLRPLDTPHRPSVDVLFRSAADVFGSRVLGVVMTGMGSDGVQGGAWVKAQGGRILTEAEETCVVYGMPRAVVEAGLSDRSVPLSAMAEAILENL
ncbi:MAG: chemotaxis response regulator protein-glutamate methylesterase [Gemmataceae bacterium]|nr:chemotaxis response regulator protein-glutamate methylesterase [Gemmataceae bacterium]